MFNNLNNLKSLRLFGNPCINRDFYEDDLKEPIELELAECGAGYALHEQQISGKFSDSAVP